MSNGGPGTGAKSKIKFPDPGVGQPVGAKAPLKTLTPKGTGPDGLVQTNDDVSKPVLKTLGDYVSSLTHDSAYGNEYAITPGTQPASIIGTDGKPAPLDVTMAGAEKVFASPADAGNQLSKYSDGMIGKGMSPVKTIVTKGKVSKAASGGGAPSNAVNGNELLKSVQGSGVGKSGALPDAFTSIDPVSQRTSAVLAYNRFTAGKAFSSAAETAEGGSYGKPPGGKEIATIQTKFGEYDPNAKVVTTRDMSKIGKSISLRASGEFVARGKGKDPENGSVQASTIIPGEAQIGITRPSSKDFEAREAFRELFGFEFGGSLESDNMPVADSYGNLNNCYEHFDSAAPVGMIALGVAMVVGARIAISALLAVGGVLTGGATGKSALVGHDALGRGFLGDYRLNGSKGWPSLAPVPISLPSKATFGFIDVNFGYNEAVNAGIAAFFGGKRGNIATQLLDTINPFGGETFKRIIESPGYYVVFVKNITRSLNTIANTMKNSFSSSNVLDIVEGVGNVMSSIKHSKAVSALNMFAIIGERVLTLEQQGFNPDDIGPGHNRISRTDAIVDNGPSHAMKSRRTESLKLAWRNSSTTSQLLLPNTAYAALRVIDGEGMAYNAMRYSDSFWPKVFVSKSSMARIPTELVKKLEADLDAEYVPFYFHDLRTGEIISFHAFIETLADNFSAEYEGSEGVGRVDPVMTYKGTKRTIDVAFTAVATSQCDFDEMWAKINKLTTMVYPQYSRGSVVADKEGSTMFTQPFSQVVAGSPMIRLRVGDVIKSNYSRANLARLFGLGDPHFTVDGNTLLSDAITSELENVGLTHFVGAIQRGEELPKGTYVKLRPNGSPGAIDVGGGYQPAVEEPGLGAGIVGALASSIGLPSGNEFIPSLAISSPIWVQIIGSRTLTIGNSNAVQYIVMPTGADASLAVSGLGYLATGTDIIVDNEVIVFNFEFNGGTKPADGNQGVVDFFSSESNIIVRSFENAGGKGAAGFITSLAYDWMNGGKALWDTERYGSRAPMIVKVTLSFTPIHDISPGIDYRGFNRAPVYNVGAVVNSIAGDANDEKSEGRSEFTKQHREIAKF